MKILPILLIFSVFAVADDKKPATPKEAPLTKLERAIIDKTLAQGTALDLQYKIEEYNKALAPIRAEQMSVIEGACKALGIPADKVQSECRVDLQWVDPATKTTDTPAGKVVGRVVWQPAVQAPASIGGAPKK